MICIRVPVDLCFQSIAGTEKVNRSFAINLNLLWEAYEATLSLGRATLGVYLTYAPSLGITDESRNCISNIRPGGMTIADAIRTIAYLAEKVLDLKYTGIVLKDFQRKASLYFPVIRLSARVRMVLELG